MKTLAIKRYKELITKNNEFIASTQLLVVWRSRKKEKLIQPILNPATPAT